MVREDSCNSPSRTLATKIVGFNEVAQSKAIQLTQKLGKNVTPEELAERARTLGACFEDMGWNLDELTSKAAQSMSSLKAPTALLSDGPQDSEYITIKNTQERYYLSWEMNDSKAESKTIKQ